MGQLLPENHFWQFVGLRIHKVLHKEHGKNLCVFVFIFFVCLVVKIKDDKSQVNTI